MPLRNHQTTLGTILLAIQGRLSSVGVWHTDYAIITTMDEQGEPPANNEYCTIVVGEQTPENDIIMGTDQQILTPIDGRVTVFVWWRSNIDQQHQDTMAMTKATMGGLELERRTLFALQLFDPITSDEINYLLAEPMRMSDSGFGVKPRKIQSGWLGIGAEFEIKYLLNLKDDLILPGS